MSSQGLIGQIVRNEGYNAPLLELIIPTLSIDRNCWGWDRAVLLPERHVIQSSSIPDLSRLGMVNKTTEGYISINITDLYTYRYTPTDSNISYDLDRFYPISYRGFVCMSKVIQNIWITKIQELKEKVSLLIRDAVLEDNPIGALEYSMFYINILCKEN